jgi:uncharacterized membrane protein YhaH (DUF805 family)
MSNETSTDLFYNFVGRIERKRKWLPMLVFVYLSLAILGIMINGMGFILFAHQKGGTIDMNMLVTSVNLAICGVFMVAGANQYMALKSYHIKLKKIHALEETIYEEVLRQEDQLR